MDKPKPHILDYEVRKVMPMSRKILLAATGGAAIVVAGVMYRAATRVVRTAGVITGPTTMWAPTTQPVSGGMAGEPKSPEP